MDGYEIYTKLNDLSDKEIADGKALIEAAEKVFSERYSDGEGDAIVNKLLNWRFKIDGKDFTDYISEGVDIGNCFAAEIVKAAVDYMFWADEMKEILN